SERILAQPVDLITVRELAGGIYFSQPKGMTDDEGYDTERYNRNEIRRIAKVAFETARLRRGKVTSVDKANVLYSSMVWRKVVTEMAAEYTDIEFNTMYVDNAAMQLILNPSQFDVILTTNMFGDILSDETAAIVGSLGLLPSISLGDRIHLFEPAGGSAPDIAGQGLANPVAQILSAALMFQYSFDRPDIGSAIHQAVAQTLGAGFFTRDLQAQDSISTSEMGDRILAALEKIEI
nr:3-isopropylmalate dehydrogenase [Candidatus Delongbacteria bacterium]